MSPLETRLLQGLLALDGELELTALLERCMQLLCTLSGWRWAAAARLLGDCGRAQMLAFCEGGTVLPGRTYEMAITPCLHLAHGGGPTLFDQVSRRFADDLPLVAMGVEHYAGIVLRRAGEVVGHVFLLHDRALDAEAQQAVTSLLQLTALHLGGRLESAGLREQLREWQRAADLDPLTALPNRRAFEREIELQLALQGRGARADSLFGIADVNGLKAVNDQRGHVEGDRLLRACASILAGSLTSGQEQLFRIGGDEFALLVDAPEAAHEDGLRERAAQWRAAIAAAGFPEAGISLGLSRLSEVDGERTRWLALADERMYADKHAQKAQRPN